MDCWEEHYALLVIMLYFNVFAAKNLILMKSFKSFAEFTTAFLPFFPLLP